MSDATTTTRQDRRHIIVVAAPDGRSLEVDITDPEQVAEASRILGRPILIRPEPPERQGGWGGGEPRVRRPPTKTSIPRDALRQLYYTEPPRSKPKPYNLFGNVPQQPRDDYYEQMMAGAMRLWQQTRGGTQLAKAVKGLAGFDRGTGILTVRGDGFWANLARGFVEPVNDMVGLAAFLSASIAGRDSNKRIGFMVKPVDAWRSDLYKELKTTEGLNDAEARTYSDIILNTYKNATKKNNATFQEIREFARDFAYKLDEAKELLKARGEKYAGLDVDYASMLGTDSAGFIMGNVLGNVGLALVGGGAIRGIAAGTKLGARLATKALPTILGGDALTAGTAAAVGAGLQVAQDVNEPWRLPEEVAGRVVIGGATNIIGAGTISSLSKPYIEALQQGTRPGVWGKVLSPTKKAVLQYVGKNVGVDVFAGAVGGASVEGVSGVAGRRGYAPTVEQVGVGMVMGGAMTGLVGLGFGHLPTSLREARRLRREYSAAVREASTNLEKAMQRSQALMQKAEIGEAGPLQARTTKLQQDVRRLRQQQGVDGRAIRNMAAELNEYTHTASESPQLNRVITQEMALGALRMLTPDDMPVFRIDMEPGEAANALVAPIIRHEQPVKAGEAGSRYERITTEPGAQKPEHADLYAIAKAVVEMARSMDSSLTDQELDLLMRGVMAIGVAARRTPQLFAMLPETQVQSGLRAQLLMRMPIDDSKITPLLENIANEWGVELTVVKSDVPVGDFVRIHEDAVRRTAEITRHTVENSGRDIPDLRLSLHEWSQYIYELENALNEYSRGIATAARKKSKELSRAAQNAESKLAKAIEKIGSFTYKTSSGGWREWVSMPIGMFLDPAERLAYFHEFVSALRDMSQVYAPGVLQRGTLSESIYTFYGKPITEAGSYYNTFLEQLSRALTAPETATADNIPILKNAEFLESYAKAKQANILPPGIAELIDALIASISGGEIAGVRTLQASLPGLSKALAEYGAVYRKMREDILENGLLNGKSFTLHEIKERIEAAHREIEEVSKKYAQAAETEPLAYLYTTKFKPIVQVLRAQLERQLVDIAAHYPAAGTLISDAPELIASAIKQHMASTPVQPQVSVVPVRVDAAVVVTNPSKIGAVDIKLDTDAVEIHVATETRAVRLSSDPAVHPVEYKVSAQYELQLQQVDAARRWARNQMRKQSSSGVSEETLVAAYLVAKALAPRFQFASIEQVIDVIRNFPHEATIGNTAVRVGQYIAGVLETAVHLDGSGYKHGLIGDDPLKAARSLLDIIGKSVVTKADAQSMYDNPLYAVEREIADKFAGVGGLSAYDWFTALAAGDFTRIPLGVIESDPLANILASYAFLYNIKKAVDAGERPTLYLGGDSPSKAGSRYIDALYLHNKELLGVVGDYVLNNYKDLPNVIKEGLDAIEKILFPGLVRTRLEGVNPFDVYDLSQPFPKFEDFVADLKKAYGDWDRPEYGDKMRRGIMNTLYAIYKAKKREYDALKKEIGAQRRNQSAARTQKDLFEPEEGVAGLPEQKSALPLEMPHTKAGEIDVEGNARNILGQLIGQTNPEEAGDAGKALYNAVSHAFRLIASKAGRGKSGQSIIHKVYGVLNNELASQLDQETLPASLDIFFQNLVARVEGYTNIDIDAIPQARPQDIQAHLARLAEIYRKPPEGGQSSKPMEEIPKGTLPEDEFEIDLDNDFDLWDRNGLDDFLPPGCYGALLAAALLGPPDESDSSEWADVRRLLYVAAISGAGMVAIKPSRLRKLLGGVYKGKPAIGEIADKILEIPHAPDEQSRMGLVGQIKAMIQQTYGGAASEAEDSFVRDIINVAESLALNPDQYANWLPLIEHAKEVFGDYETLYRYAPNVRAAYYRDRAYAPALHGYTDKEANALSLPALRHDNADFSTLGDFANWLMVQHAHMPTYLGLLKKWFEIVKVPEHEQYPETWVRMAIAGNLLEHVKPELSDIGRNYWSSLSKNKQAGLLWSNYFVDLPEVLNNFLATAQPLLSRTEGDATSNQQYKKLVASLAMTLNNVLYNRALILSSLAVRDHQIAGTDVSGSDVAKALLKIAKGTFDDIVMNAMAGNLEAVLKIMREQILRAPEYFKMKGVPELKGNEENIGISDKIYDAFYNDKKGSLYAVVERATAIPSKNTLGWDDVVWQNVAKLLKIAREEMNPEVLDKALRVFAHTELMTTHALAQTIGVKPDRYKPVLAVERIQQEVANYTMLVDTIGEELARLARERHLLEQTIAAASLINENAAPRIVMGPAYKVTSKELRNKLGYDAIEGPSIKLDVDLSRLPVLRDALKEYKGGSVAELMQVPELASIINEIRQHYTASGNVQEKENALEVLIYPAILMQLRDRIIALSDAQQKLATTLTKQQGTDSEGALPAMDKIQQRLQEVMQQEEYYKGVLEDFQRRVKDIERNFDLAGAAAALLSKWKEIDDRATFLRSERYRIMANELMDAYVTPLALGLNGIALANTGRNKQLIKAALMKSVQSYGPEHKAYMFASVLSDHLLNGSRVISKDEQVTSRQYAPSYGSIREKAIAYATDHVQKSGKEAFVSAEDIADEAMQNAYFTIIDDILSGRHTQYWYDLLIHGIERNEDGTITTLTPEEAASKAVAIYVGRLQSNIRKYINEDWISNRDFPSIPRSDSDDEFVWDTIAEDAAGRPIVGESIEGNIFDEVSNIEYGEVLAKPLSNMDNTIINYVRQYGFSKKLYNAILNDPSLFTLIRFRFADDLNAIYGKRPAGSYAELEALAGVSLDEYRQIGATAKRERYINMLLRHPYLAELYEKVAAKYADKVPQVESGGRSPLIDYAFVQSLQELAGPAANVVRGLHDMVRRSITIFNNLAYTNRQAIEYQEIDAISRIQDYIRRQKLREYRLQKGVAGSVNEEEVLPKIRVLPIDYAMEMFRKVFSIFTDPRYELSESPQKQVSGILSRILGKEGGLWDETYDAWKQKYLPYDAKYQLFHVNKEASRELKNNVRKLEQKLIDETIAYAAKRALQKDDYLRDVLSRVIENMQRLHSNGMRQLQIPLRQYTTLDNASIESIAKNLLQATGETVIQEIQTQQSRRLVQEKIAQFLQANIAGKQKFSSQDAETLAGQIAPIITNLQKKMRGVSLWLPMIADRLDEVWGHYGLMLHEILGSYKLSLDKVSKLEAATGVTDMKTVEKSLRQTENALYRMLRLYEDEEWRPPVDIPAHTKPKSRTESYDAAARAAEVKLERAAEAASEEAPRSLERAAYRNILLRVATDNDIPAAQRNKFIESIARQLSSKAEFTLDDVYAHLNGMLARYKKTGKTHESLIRHLDDFTAKLGQYLQNPTQGTKKISRELFKKTKAKNITDLETLLPALKKESIRNILPVLLTLTLLDDDDDDSPESTIRAALLMGIIGSTKAKAGSKAKFQSVAFGRSTTRMLGGIMAIQLAKQLGIGQDDPLMQTILSAAQVAVLTVGLRSAWVKHGNLKNLGQRIVPELTIHHFFPPRDGTNAGTLSWAPEHLVKAYHGAGWEPEEYYKSIAYDLWSTKHGRKIIDYLRTEYGAVIEDVDDLARYIELVDKNVAPTPFAQNANSQINPLAVALDGKLRDGTLLARDGLGTLMALRAIFEPHTFTGSIRPGESEAYNTLEQIRDHVVRVTNEMPDKPYEEMIVGYLGFNPNAEGTARYGGQINPMAPFYAAAWALKNIYKKISGKELDDWTEEFSKWTQQSHAERKKILQDLFPIIVEVDKIISTKIARNELHGEDVSRYAAELERKLFRQIAETTSVDESYLASLVATYYAYRAGHDVSSALLTRSLALSRIPLDIKAPLSNVKTALDMLVNKKYEYAATLNKMQQQLEAGVDEETAATIESAMKTVKGMMNQIDELQKEIQATLDVALASSARRYIQHWHMHQGEYRVRWKEVVQGEDGKPYVQEYMRIFETKREKDKFVRELTDKGIKPDTVREEVGSHGETDDIVQGLQQEEYRIRYNLKRLSAYHNEELMGYANALTRITKKALAIEQRMRAIEEEGGNVEVLGKQVKKLAEEVLNLATTYKVLEDESLNELTAIVASINSGMNVKESMANLYITFKSLQEIYGLIYGINTAELSAPFYIQRIRKTTNQLMHRKNVMGYLDDLKPWQYVDYLSSSMALQFQKAVRSYERMLHLREYTKAHSLLAQLGLHDTKLADAISNVLARDYNAANPYSDLPAVQISGFVRMAIAAGALGMNVASAIRNWLEASYAGFSSAVYDKITRNLTLKQLAMYWKPMLDKNGIPTNPILRAVDEYALAHGLYERGIFSDVAKYSRRATRSKFKKAIAKLEDFGFSLQSATEYQANRGLFLRRLQWEMMTNPESAGQILESIHDADPGRLLQLVREGFRGMERGQGALDARGQSLFEHFLMKVPGLNIATVLMTTVIRLGMQSISDIYGLWRLSNKPGERSKLIAAASFLTKLSVFGLISGAVRGMLNQPGTGDMLNAILEGDALFTDQDEESIKMKRETLHNTMRRSTVSTLMKLGMPNQHAEMMYDAIMDGWLSAFTNTMLSTSGNITSMLKTVSASRGEALKRAYESAKKSGFNTEEFNRSILRLISIEGGRLFDAFRQLRDGHYYSGKYPVNIPFGISDFVTYAIWGTPYELIKVRELDARGYPILNRIGDRIEFINKIGSLRGIDLGKGDFYNTDPWQVLSVLNRDVAYSLWERLLTNHNRVWQGKESVIKSYYLDAALKKYDEALATLPHHQSSLLNKERENFKKEVEKNIDALLMAKSLLYTLYEDKEFWSKYTDILPRTEKGEIVAPAIYTNYRPPYDRTQEIRDYRMIDDIIGYALSHMFVKKINKLADPMQEGFAPHDISIPFSNGDNNNLERILQENELQLQTELDDE